jgi:hypothetical protein
MSSNTSERINGLLGISIRKRRRNATLRGDERNETGTVGASSSRLGTNRKPSDR